MRFWVVDAQRVPIETTLGNGVCDVSIGDLAGWVEAGDVLLCYESQDEYRTCVIQRTMLVLNSSERTRTSTVDVRLGDFSVSPSSAAGRGKWKNNPRLCLDANKVISYGLLTWASYLFEEYDWEPSAVRDAVGWAIRFDPKRPRAADEDGFVYLMRGESTHKIGKSKDPERRLREVLRESGREIDLVHVFQSNWYSRAEWELHQRFKAKRAHLEWFYLDDDDIDEIMSIESMHYPIN